MAYNKGETYHQLLSMATTVMLVAKADIEVRKSSFKVPIIFLHF